MRNLVLLEHTPSKYYSNVSDIINFIFYLYLLSGLVVYHFAWLNAAQVVHAWLAA